MKRRIRPSLQIGPGVEKVVVMMVTLNLYSGKRLATWLKLDCLLKWHSALTHVDTHFILKFGESI